MTGYAPSMVPWCTARRIHARASPPGGDRSSSKACTSLRPCSCFSRVDFLWSWCVAVEVCKRGVGKTRRREWDGRCEAEEALREAMRAR